jgi:hypothetical protein
VRQNNLHSIITFVARRPTTLIPNLSRNYLRTPRPSSFVAPRRVRIQVTLAEGFESLLDAALRGFGFEAFQFQSAEFQGVFVNGHHELHFRRAARYRLVQTGQHCSARPSRIDRHRAVALRVGHEPEDVRRLHGSSQRVCRRGGEGNANCFGFVRDVLARVKRKCQFGMDRVRDLYCANSVVTFRLY